MVLFSHLIMTFFTSNTALKRLMTPTMFRATKYKKHQSNLRSMLHSISCAMISITRQAHSCISTSLGIYEESQSQMSRLLTLEQTQNPQRSSFLMMCQLISQMPLIFSMVILTQISRDMVTSIFSLISRTTGVSGVLLSSKMGRKLDKLMGLRVVSFLANICGLVSTRSKTVSLKICNKQLLVLQVETVLRMSCITQIFTN